MNKKGNFVSIDKKMAEVLNNFFALNFTGKLPLKTTPLES